VVASTSGTAERLQKTAGAWRLEFQQLVYHSPVSLRPKRFAVQGEQAILQQLRELSGHEPLVRDAERLFRGAAGEGSYIAREGRWFPELLPDTMPEPEASLDADAAPEFSEDRERGRLLLEELARRMIALEKSVEQLGEKISSSLSSLAVAAAQVDPAARARTEQAMNPAHVAMQPTAAMAGMHGGVSPMAATGAQPAMGAAAQAPAPSAPSRKSISLPAATALTDLIRGLAGPDANLQPSDRTDYAGLSAAGTPIFFAAIQDNAGEEAGCMLFDLEAALRMAGALLMESEEMIESLLEEKMMSEEMLDAASEVCNTLTSALNKVSGNPHLRSGKMQPFNEARAAQVATAAKRDDYRYNHGGRFSLVAS
jgi:hypothetical protein